MRIVVDRDGEIVAAYDIPDGWSVARDGSEATGPTQVEQIGGDAALVDPVSRIVAGPGEKLIASDDLQIGAVKSGRTYINPAPPLDELRAGARRAIVADIDALVAPILGRYSEAERASWPTQENEAWGVVDEGYTAADAPLLAVLAAASGQTLRQVADGVLAKAAQFRAITAAAQGLRHAAETALAGAGDVAAIDAAITSHRAACAAKAAELGL